MGFLDLSTSVASKKHVDFNDARYQLSDKLRQGGKQNIRSTFTLYDNKEQNKMSIQDISAAYALSDKRLPIGELLNKMVDLIIDMEDGILDTEKDAVYAWKYSVALLEMYDDKSKRQEKLSSFDNSLKNAIINSQVFIKRYPGKYTHRTNFFNQSVKDSMMADILATFKDVALPRIHDSAINQSKAAAEKHNNPILDRIVQWAIANYRCEVDSFFEIKEDEKTNLYYSINTIILHLRNGYDMSIIGYVGTDHDDKFAISIFNANDLALAKHDNRMSQDDLQKTLAEITNNESVDPLTKLLSMEKKKSEVLKQQYDILANIRPMIPAEALELQAAESVVGKDYIWGCKQWRENHDDLPADFKLEDVELPEVEGESNDDAVLDVTQQLTDNLDTIANSMETETVEADNAENKAKTIIEEKSDIVSSETQKDAIQNNERMIDTVQIADATKSEDPVLEDAMPTQHDQNYEHANIDDLFKEVEQESLFDTSEPKQPTSEKQFGDPDRVEFRMPTLSFEQINTPATQAPKAPEKEFDTTSTLLPGFTPVIEKPKDDGPSITKDAKPVPTFNDTAPKWKDTPQQTIPSPIVIPQNEDEATPVQPDILLNDLDNLDALFE